MELVLVIVGAWCVLVGLEMSLLIVASDADDRSEEALGRARRAPPRRPRRWFTKRPAECALQERERPMSRT